MKGGTVYNSWDEFEVKLREGTGYLRILRGKDFDSLSRLGAKPRPIVFVTPVEGSEQLQGYCDICSNLTSRYIIARKSMAVMAHTDEDPSILLSQLNLALRKLLTTIGWPSDDITTSIDENDTFYLSLLSDKDDAVEPIWDNVIPLLYELFPDMINRIHGINSGNFLSGLSGLRDITLNEGVIPLSRVEFEAKDNPTIGDFRLFMAHSEGGNFNRLFNGLGYTENERGERGVAEYIIKNTSIDWLYKNNHIVLLYTTDDTDGITNQLGRRDSPTAITALEEAMKKQSERLRALRKGGGNKIAKQKRKKTKRRRKNITRRRKKITRKGYRNKTKRKKTKKKKKSKQKKEV